MSHIGLEQTRPYPFTRLKSLFAGINPGDGVKKHISLGIGEPMHPLPECIRQAFVDNLGAMSHYPSTTGMPELREAIARWCARRYAVELNPATQIVPCLGSREALFSLVQSLIDTRKSLPAKPAVVMPSPFYQIYEGAAFMAGAEAHYLPLTKENNFTMDLASVGEEVLARTQLVFVCSPGNPTGKTLGLSDWKVLFELSAKYGFTIASDECYSEIYLDETKPPLGALTAAKMLGIDDFKNIVVFQSLSKRSNAPGMRSGFVAGDAAIMKDFILYRTYHGSAMNPTVQLASIAAWNDETHVLENRNLYRQKFAVAQPVIDSVLEAPVSDASFYLWAKVPGDDQT
ncbi:MAG: succinyldiaminopimelate transaminase, partial [Sutterellaceae bacterium]|nr:succinyldiaminopimelate transaminase [Sutterellaceae bacterium]